MAANQALSLNLGTATTMQLGKGTRTLTATTKPSNDLVTWTNSNDAVATIAQPAAGTRAEQTIPNAGHTVIITPKATGTTVITATSSAGSASITVTVVDDDTDDVSISLTQTELSMYAGDQKAVTASTSPENQTVTWSTSNGKVATVENGNITAVNPGLARITATSPSGKTATINLTVKAPEVTVSKSSTEIVMGTTETLTANVSPVGKIVTWKSDNPTIASVSSAGVVTGNNPGSATIHAQIINDQNEVIADATCYVTVIPSTATVTKDPLAANLTYDGQNLELVTAGTAEYGTMMYSLGANSTSAPEDNEFSESIPTGKDAGTYYVWYYAKGSTAGNTVLDSSEKKCVTVTIKRAPFTMSFQESDVTKTIGDGEFTNILNFTGNYGSTVVTYSCTGVDNYATFSSSDGKFSAFNASTGATTLTVVATVTTEDPNYECKNDGSKATYTLRIVENVTATGANATGSPSNWPTNTNTLNITGDHGTSQHNGQGL